MIPQLVMNIYHLPILIATISKSSAKSRISFTKNLTQSRKQYTCLGEGTKTNQPIVGTPRLDQTAIYLSTKTHLLRS